MSGCNVLICIQARVHSTRLEKKLFLPLNKITVLEQIVKRCMNVRGDDVAVAVCVPATDELEVFERTGIIAVTGPEQDILTRLMNAVAKYEPKYMVRVTGDCPLVCPRLIELMVHNCHQKSRDMTLNWKKRTFPNGLDLEVYNVDFLRRIDLKLMGADREWFATVAEQLPETYLSYLESEESMGDWRWTLDYPEDYEFMKQVYNAMGGRIWDCSKISKWLTRHPGVVKINQKYNTEFGARPV